MATGPVISIRDEDGNPINSWAIGTLTAQTDPKPSIDIYIWNNYAGTTAVSDLKDAYITVVDENGNVDSTQAVVSDTWVKACLVDISGEEATAIGGNTTKTLNTTSSSIESGIIKGTANTGTLINSTDNFVHVQLTIEPTMNATPGRQKFYLRINGSFT